MQLELPEYTGFEIVKATDFQKLDELRDQIFSILKKYFPIGSDNIDYELNNLHQHFEKLTDSELNTTRVKIIHEINASVNCGKLVFDAFKTCIEKSLICSEIL